MTIFEIAQLLFSTGIAGAVLVVVFRSGKLIEKIDRMDNSIQKMEADISDIKVRLGKLEQKNQDDFQAEMKLLLKERK